MKQIAYIFLVLILASCSAENEKDLKEQNENKKDIQTKKVVNKKDLVHIEGNVFTEYYPDKITIKFQGTQDEDGKRHGKWLYFSDQGVELSMTVYKHGDKHGHSIVKYPNGALHYTGEYIDNVQVGIWKTYSIKGNMVDTKDFGSI